ncbi:MAG: hypothetical protein JSS61_06805 [Verrucomicrobia bacterium]|nr:hypothetical protein [Verrucomicrobiota bacterium]
MTKVILLLLAFVPILWAEPAEDVDAEVSPAIDDYSELKKRLSALENKLGALKIESAEQTFGANLATARPLYDGWDLHGRVDLLVWNLEEGGAQVAVHKSKAKELDFGWDFGFRLGTGYNFEHDAWDTDICFSYFKTHTSKTVSGGANPQFGMPITTDSEKVHRNWKLDYYVLDWMFGRNFFVSKFLSFRPQLGMEIAWILQKSHGVIEAEKVRSKNHFFGVGPRIGIDTNWYLANHFSLFGTLTGALLWGSYEVEERETHPFIKANGDIHLMAPNAQTALGLLWDSHLAENRFHLSILLAYEFQYWWRQNQMLTLFESSSAAPFRRESQDLSLNGVTLDVRLDF